MGEAHSESKRVLLAAMTDQTLESAGPGGLIALRTVHPRTLTLAPLDVFKGQH